jgi:hypothetical protein
MGVAPAYAAPMGNRWLPVDFIYPQRVDLAGGVHLRPIRESDVDMDMAAVLGSRQSLWQRYGPAWGWPSEDLSAEADRAELARHAADMERRETFAYAILDPDETTLYGCIYLNPPEPDDLAEAGEPADVRVTWWVIDKMTDTDLGSELAEFVPGWINETWGFRHPRFYP